MRRNGARNLGNIQDAFLAFRDKQLIQTRPDFLRSVRRRCEKPTVSFVGSVVLLDKVPDVDFFLPESDVETLPRVASRGLGDLVGGCGGHVIVLG